MSMSEPPTSILEAEPGSFRDRNGRVFYFRGGVYRGLNKQAYQDWLQLAESGFYARARERSAIIETTDVTHSFPADAGASSWHGILQHRRLPFVSYPYEWSFNMLKDAALLHLELLTDALEEDFITRDGSAYNVQWLGHSPVFIDTAAFAPIRAGDPWHGYRQFCQLFLFPLMVQAYRDIPFRPLLRGNIDGLSVRDASSLLGGRANFRPGVLSHVVLQARLARTTAASGRAVRSEIRRAGFNRQLIQTNIARLTRIIERLRLRQAKSEWSHYTDLHHYSDADTAAKKSFVREITFKNRWRLVWDLGANTGTYARIAAENADHVLAMDADELAVDRLYSALGHASPGNIQPLVMNLADPSPALGWRNAERKALTGRARPDLVLCLALIHHLVIGANVPLRELIDWLADLGAALVMEFVTREDPMVQQLLRNRDDIFEDYNQPVFEASLAARFTVRTSQPLPSGTRILYFATPRI